MKVKIVNKFNKTKAGVSYTRRLEILENDPESLFALQLKNDTVEHVLRRIVNYLDVNPGVYRLQINTKVEDYMTGDLKDWDYILVEWEDKC